MPLTDWAIAELKALQVLANGSRFVLPGKNPERQADPKLITRGVKRLLPAFLAHGIDAFVPHDLRRTGRTTLGRLKVSPFVGVVDDRGQLQFAAADGIPRELIPSQDDPWLVLSVRDSGSMRTAAMSSDATIPGRP